MEFVAQGHIYDDVPDSCQLEILNQEVCLLHSAAISRLGKQPLQGGEYVLMCSCCGAGVLRSAVKVIPEFVYSKASACACVMTN
jgi:hypothetical protein